MLLIDNLFVFIQRHRYIVPLSVLYAFRYNYLFYMRNFLLFSPFVITEKPISRCVQPFRCKGFGNLLCDDANMQTGCISFFFNRIVEKKLAEGHLAPRAEHIVIDGCYLLLFPLIRRVDCCRCRKDLCPAVTAYPHC